ncbi:hypothetical protein COB55_04365 [Candidatus Wolfebacteria bacterium]|nr:MAG: hypothetical protein COB55_04365 [Candidatus Wolfebacteria bacterium]
MKTIISLTLIFISLTVFSQDYNDLIITQDEDTIQCKIRSVDKNYISYVYSDDGSKKPGRINKSDVLSHKWMDKPESVILKEQQAQNSLIPLTSGDYLIKGSKNMLLGISITAGGSIVSGIILSSASKPEHFQSASIIGLVGGLIGLGFNIYGIIQIGKSGKIHNKNSDLSLGINNKGLSLCYKF